MQEQWRFSDFYSTCHYKMSRFLLLFVFLVVLINGQSLPAAEEIDPVDLAYNCVKPNTIEESETESPVLLMHGVGGSKKLWSRLITLLVNETKREVCAVDLRNHGDSPWDNRMDVEAMTVDIGQFLDKQGIKKVNFVGQSMGGKVAIHYTLKNPDRVDSIAVQDISPNSIPHEAVILISVFQQLLKQALKSIPEGLTEDGAQKSVINFLNTKLEKMGSTERLPDHFSEFIEVKLDEGKWRFKYNFAVISEAMKDVENTFTKSTGLYEGPTLFIYGTKSPFKVYENKEDILKLFPNAEFVPVEGSSHMNLDLFKEFDDAIISFLNKVN